MEEGSLGISRKSSIWYKCLSPQNICHTQNGLFSASLSNLLSFSLSEACCVNSVPNQVLAMFVEFIIFVPSHNNMVKLEEQLWFTIGKASKKIPKVCNNSGCSI